MSSDTLRAPTPLTAAAPHPLHAALNPDRVAALLDRVVASPRADRHTTTAPFTGLPLVSAGVWVRDLRRGLVVARGLRALTMLGAR